MEKLIAPVRCARRRYVAVAVWPDPANATDLDIELERGDGRTEAAASWMDEVVKALTELRESAYRIQKIVATMQTLSGSTSEAEAAEMRTLAEGLSARVRAWLAASHSELLS